MSPAEREQIRLAAVERGRLERREQGIPAQVKDLGMIARIVTLLTRIDDELDGGLDASLQRLGEVLALHEVTE